MIEPSVFILAAEVAVLAGAIAAALAGLAAALRNSNRQQPGAVRVRNDESRRRSG